MKKAYLRHIRGPAYRCFLPDLTRFTGSYCAGPQSLLRSHQRTTALFIILYFASDRQSLSWYPEIFFSSGSSVSPLLIPRSSAEERQSESRRPFSLSHSAGDLSFSFPRHPQKFRFIDHRYPQRFCLCQFAAGGFAG